MTLLGKDLIMLYIFQFYEKENIRGVVSLNEEWELEDFSNSEEVCFIFSASQGTKIFQYCTKSCHAGRVTYNFHLSCKHMHSSFKRVCN